jgi:hypothetical protein
MRALGPRCQSANIKNAWEQYGNIAGAKTAYTILINPKTLCL